MTVDSTCICEPYPNGDGPDIDCPIHGKYPHIKVTLIEGEGLLLDFSEHIKYLGLKDGDVIYVALHTANPLDEERAERDRMNEFRSVQGEHG